MKTRHILMGALLAIGGCRREGASSGPVPHTAESATLPGESELELTPEQRRIAGLAVRMVRGKGFDLTGLYLDWVTADEDGNWEISFSHREPHVLGGPGFVVRIRKQGEELIDIQKYQ